MKKCLIGPFSESDDELLPINPSEFYSCGVLYGHLENMDNMDMINFFIEFETANLSIYRVQFAF